jgi:beta-glucanase (GH16 family)
VQKFQNCRSVFSLANKKMQKILLIAVIVLFAACSSDNDNPSPSIQQYDGYTLVWNDEFDGAQVDREKWTYETGDGTDFGLPPGWGNNELQLYQDDISTVSIQTEDDLSVLKITAFKNGPNAYRSGKITTQDLLSVRYGRIEASMKLPEGQGIWPAFWALGVNHQDPIDWPGCGEIDIMEMLGNEPDRIYSTVHYVDGENSKGEIQGEVTSTADLSEEFHLYRLDWTPEKLMFYLDDQLINEVPITSDMKEFQRAFYLILNVAVGGNWPGNPDETTSFPQSLTVDYVRVYEATGADYPPSPELVIAEEVIGQFIDPAIFGYAVRAGFDRFGELEIKIYGGGGEPDVVGDSDATDGDFSLSFAYPGTTWGGAYLEMVNEADLTDLQGANLTFDMKPSGTLVDVEVKLESSNQTSNAAVFLTNYESTPLSDGWVQYTIPMSDFSGLDLSKLKIPFSLWNPMSAPETYFEGNILVDNIRIQ